MKDSADSSRLPASQASQEGVTETSLGDATMADLKRGYSKCPDVPEESGKPGFMNSADPYPPAHGFLNRPAGWER